MIGYGFRIAVMAALLVASPQVAGGGPLQDCCSAKGAFCTLPFVGGKGACTAAGGQLFRANACLRTQECGVAHQLPASARVRVQAPAKIDTVPMQGAGDIIETEMLELRLQGVGPVLGPSSLQKQPSQPAPGMVVPLMPPAPFPAESFFDVFYELTIPDLGTVHTTTAQRLTAEDIGEFLPIGVAYRSINAAALFDAHGDEVGELIELELTFLEPADSDGDGVVDSGDLCPATMPQAIVDDNGCSVEQLCPCPARSHGQHVRCVAHAARRLRAAELITQRQFAALVRQAAHMPCDDVGAPTSTATPTPTDTPEPTPCMCPNVFIPVCGFDGVTYSNACFANCAGVAVACPGLCPCPLP